MAAGDAVVAPAVTRRLIEAFSPRLPTETGRTPLEDRLHGLSDRERAVLGELTRGHTNGEIAERLIVSEATVKVHVGRILATLGLRDRVQVVIFAYENGIVRPGVE